MDGIKRGATRGRLVVVSGPSGVGKSTVCHQLCEKLPAEFSVSVTTRKPRPGEIGDRDYRYISQDEFDRMKASGDLLEVASVYGNWYGTPRPAVQQALDEGRIIILEIDIQGCIQIRQKMPEARAFFLLPPTAEEQRRRIEGRQTDAAEEIRARLAKADGEIRYASESGCFDEFIINDDLDQTVKRMYTAILKE